MRIFRKPRIQYDYEKCNSERQLKAVLDEINEKGYVLVSVICDYDCMTVFFGRPVDG